jgi:hypothetical protein
MKQQNLCLCLFWLNYQLKQYVALFCPAARILLNKKNGLIFSKDIFRSMEAY